MAYGLLARAWRNNTEDQDEPIYVDEFHCDRTNLTGANADVIIKQASDLFGETGWDYLEFLITSDADFELTNPKSK